MPRKLWIAIPVMNESEYLPKTVSCILDQDYHDFHVVLCVNQPDEWWTKHEKQSVCEDNLKVLKWLQAFNDQRFTIIDKCSPGNGWNGNYYGVGWARKTAMDHIANLADINDLILSLDADTVFGKDYFSQIVHDIELNSDCSGVTVEYYHKLTGDEVADRAILRYEIYMRLYAINMMSIHNPYAFTAIGSAMGCTVKAYKSIGGITPHKSGEDFYFVEKLRKHGKILIHTETEVYPAARFSDRVFFGTGPAMIKGAKGDWTSYPFYLPEYFEELRDSFINFRQLRIHDVDFPLRPFLANSFKSERWWSKLSDNFKSEVQFYNACVRKVDGLVILQYLRYRQANVALNDDECLIKNLEHHFLGYELPLDMRNFSLYTSDILLINQLRNILTEKEIGLRKQTKVLKF